MSSKNYKIPEMSCMHCVKTIQSITQKLSGITKSQISLENKSLYIEFDSSFLEEQLRKELEDEGYSLNENSL